MSACATSETEIFVGQRVRLRCRFMVDDVVVDPTTVALKLRVNGGPVAAYAYPTDISRNGIGDYQRDHEADTAGVYEVVWEGTGTCDAVTKHQFVVRATGF